MRPVKQKNGQVKMKVVGKCYLCHESVEFAISFFRQHDDSVIVVFYRYTGMVVAFSKFVKVCVALIDPPTVQTQSIEFGSQVDVPLTNEMMSSGKLAEFAECPHLDVQLSAGQTILQYPGMFLLEATFIHISFRFGGRCETAGVTAGGEVAFFRMGKFNLCWKCHSCEILS